MGNKGDAAFLPREKMGDVRYIDRKTGELVTESVMGDKALRFAYETLLGRTLWPVLFGSGLISRYMGRKYDAPESKASIASLVAIPGCRAEEAAKPVEEYASFNEFFTRRLKPGSRPLGEGFVSPADGRLMLYLNADAETPFPLKGAKRNLKEVFAPSFSRGRNAASPLVAPQPSTPNPQPSTPNPQPSTSCDIVVVRLAPVDYHRFHFPCDCTVEGDVAVIPGKYHSVNPIALVRHPDVYADNERQIVRCKASFGDFWMVDVGAFGVGTIVQTYLGTKHGKGAEKGYFKFGGSTVLLALPAGAIAFDGDLVRNSAAGRETRVLCGERIGTERN